MTCMYLKQKINRKLECKKDKNRIPFKDCSGCPFKDFETNDSHIIKSPIESGNLKQKVDKMKSKSSKLTKLERNRFSLFTNNKNKCMFCPSETNLTWHEIFRGRNRQNSMKYGLCLRMCLRCHELYQEDLVFNREWHVRGQIKFIETYPDLKFKDIFRINYLDNQ